MALVTYRRDEHCVRLQMDDGKVNALSPAMLSELHEGLERAEAEGAPVVLQGRDTIFSAGFDLRVLRGGGPEAADLLLSGFKLAERLLSFPSPVVVACGGHAIAMALFLALSADYRIGVRGDYRLVANEVAIGMTLPRAALVICRYRLSPSAFDRVTLLAEPVTPEDAVMAGVLDRVVSSGALGEEVVEVVARMGQLDAAAHWATKRRARHAVLEDLGRAIAADDAEFRASLETG